MLNVTTCYGNTALATLATATANIVTNSSGSNTVIKLNNVVLSNFSGSAVTANVMINRSSTIYYLGGTVSIPANSTLVLLAKDNEYLENKVQQLEGKYLEALEACAKEKPYGLH